jgi:hypothetical protein
VTDVCIYTANIGGHDLAPRPQQAQDLPVEWLYFDDPARPVVVDESWVVHRPDPVRADPNLAAKWWKLHPPVGYEYAIWIDANMQITHPSFAREALAALAGHSFACYAHPRRDDLWDEIDASLGAEAQNGKYDAAQLHAQGDAYAAWGMPRHYGLWAGGVLVWTRAAWDLAKDWWDECVWWSPQDQVSLPFVCWARNETPAVFGHRQVERYYYASGRNRVDALANRWLRIWPHRVRTW